MILKLSFGASVYTSPIPVYAHGHVFLNMKLHCKARQTAVVKDKREKQQKDKHLILTMEALSKALWEDGVNVMHQEYFLQLRWILPLEKINKLS
ncbi:hypothetical protein SLE2022_033880 [Rubroshorea leprosula]